MLAALLLAGLWVPALDEYDGFHSAVARAGDVNADGVPDFMVATRTRHDGSSGWFHQKREHVWVLSGVDGSVIHVLRGERERDRFGRSLAAAGDVNGDGWGDVVVGAGGYALVVSGRTGRALFRLTCEPPDYGFGFAVGGGGDVDGDGHADVIVGAPSGVRGSAYVYSGRTGRLLHAVRGADHAGGEDCGWGEPYGMGTAVAILPDLDGDGCCEFIASDPSYPDPRDTIAYEDDDPAPAWGRVGIYSGPGADLFHTLQMTEWDRHFGYLGLGWTVGHAGDFDGDGTPDLFASAVNSLVRVYSGKTFEILADVNGPWGNMHSEGASVDAAGDVDGDGKDDVVWGANETLDGLPCSDRGWASVLTASRCGFWFNADTKCEGIDVSGLGDVNRDGFADVVVAQRLGQVVRVLSGPFGDELYSVDLEVLYERALRESPRDR